MRGGGDFWSRRKAAVAAEADAELQAQEAALRAEEQAALEKKSDDEILKELDLPDPDTLGAGDDFAAFMKQAVPERLRRRALRRLWVSNPVLANLDALVDYGEDYTDAANVIENLQSTYVVGKGMLAHVEEMARQAEEAAAEDAPDGLAEDGAEVDVVEPAEAPEMEPEDDPTALAAAPEIEEHAETAEEEALVPTRRRMRFDFAS